ncbi:hypothetical protein [Macrococcus armenti]|uniref:hypothetical protein n=1 Tax=Macrococcus armenti TaxID=2875764 RepID=UPI001CCC99F4|nr:hypothetical protein [Macrococcus armenti]UBH08038.1 hypothetical protein LAU41_08375 [Macrococcus armenti]UBH10270.1 hypothetical protein LAU38_08300 [Macrococcus armenti]
MEEIKSAGFDILNKQLSPFMQFENQHRVRFYGPHLTYFKYRRLVHHIFGDSINLLFLSSAYKEQKFRLWSVLDITNYKEYKVEQPQYDLNVAMTQIKNISETEAVNYIKFTKIKETCPIISYLYNDQTFIRLSPFYIDVISKDSSVIEWIKREFEREYAQDFDNDEVITEEEWYGE